MQSILFPTALFPSLLWFAYLLLYDNRALPLGSGLSMTSGVLPWHEDDNRLPLELSLHSPVRENEDK